MKVPRLLVLTDRHACERHGRDLPATIAAVAAAGAPAVLFREKDLPAPARRRLGEAVADVLRGHDTALVVASDPVLADHLDADALHLAAADPTPPSRRGTRPFGRSCHDPDEVERARGEGAAYATVSPVFPTASKPGHGPALALGGLARLAQQAATLPVVALGGIDADRAVACLAAGASGIAVQGAVMNAADPAAAVQALLEATRSPAEERP